jgi:hypothetical protein
MVGLFVGGLEERELGMREELVRLSSVMVEDVTVKSLR